MRNTIIGIFCIVELAACAASPPPTAAMQQQFQEIYQQRIQQMIKTSSATNIRQNKTQAIAPIQKQRSPQVSEGDLASEIASIPTIPANTGVRFSSDPNMDGFTANGSRYMDAEGRILKYNFDSLSGNVVYLIKIGSTNYATIQSGKKYAIKFVRPTVNVAPIQIATAIKYQNGTWKIETTTGKQLSGNDLILTSKGFLVLRQYTEYGKNTGFLYTIGKNITSITPPDGYYINTMERSYTVISATTGSAERRTTYIHADIASTGYVLLKRNDVDVNGSLLSMYHSLKGLGSLVGGHGNYDYALYNFHTKHLIKLEMSADNKDSSVKWFKGKSGIYAVYITHGVQDVYGLDLATGFRKRLFHRMLGFMGFSAYVGGHGNINVLAGSAMGDDKINNLGTFMAAPKDKEAKFIHAS